MRLKFVYRAPFAGTSVASFSSKELALFFICLAAAAITADANNPVLLLLFSSNKQIHLITSCVPGDFAQENPTRHQVFRLANAKIHKLGVS